MKNCAHTSDISSCLSGLLARWKVSVLRLILCCGTFTAGEDKRSFILLHIGKHLIKVSPLIQLTWLKSGYEGLVHRHLYVKDSVHIMQLSYGGWVEIFAGSELCFLWPLG